MRCFVSQAGGIGAEFAGALQGDSLFVKDTRQDHLLIERHQTVEVPCQRRHLLTLNQRAVTIQKLKMIHLEGCDRSRHLETSVVLLVWIRSTPRTLTGKPELYARAA